MEERRYEKAAACDAFGADLAAFLENEERPGVLAHAQECPFCRAVLADLEQVRSVSQAMPREEPPARVWPNIRSMLRAEGIVREPARSWRQWFPRFAPFPDLAPVGALACLVVLGAALLVSPRGFERALSFNQVSEREREAASPAFPSEYSNLARTVREMESSYQSRQVSLEPSIKATYAKSLESLNRSIHECLESIRQEPTNTLAREYLVAAYQHKAEVLASALEIDIR